MNTPVYRPITAAVTRGKGAPFALEAAQIRNPRGDEVLVRIVATGMCHTDMIVRDQYYPVPLPAVLGHEGAGVVEAIGPLVKGLQVGDHVVMSYGYCGHCLSCGSGHTAYCQDFFGRNFSGADPQGESALQDKDGARLNDHFFAQSSFATLALSRENNAVKVSREAPLELLGPLGCGIQTGAGAVINSLKVTPGSSFAAFGGGAVGLSAVLAARVAGATTIIVVDVVPSRLALATELGATHVVNSKDADPVAFIREITGGGVNFALESTGRPAVLRQAVDALGSRGSLGVVGAPALGTTAEFDVNDLLLGGKTIRGIVEGDSVPQKFIPELVSLYLQGRFPFDKLVKFYSFEDINQAAEDSEKGITLKPIIRIGG
ncbi:NAD(P)-dependent alcohol dehydrogenase [Pseudomonas sp. GD03651]|jgi:aryl-alcohol dehydrogenase|uniref:NAD(P)-dependent alcohol dehydrogenase n=1 Tax=Pseudomonas TaxID=286 RepID=UPI00032B7BA2|nr:MULTISPECIES: NAD(P)-dependent alcohol dehydrogenase [Pseudomonas]ELV1376257.1 NAD(P)-dependent alcohol dehydrogenase [Pseudomonas aeruginosa]TXI00872.1 MAG: NAD(P)-dependent alcohol dehydrogenase [Pseudomonas monteilii]AGL46506.1 aryl-alcohol dehydrogenase [Pseudomonas aeruginosa PA96]ELF6208080.1 NAD(P)-dependent alcohol dehydrogenase [Pseudomonas putida]MCE0904027.1 NAD(P)-dependent alcohol dehydrogenase [Pseudomonas alloputida]